MMAREARVRSKRPASRVRRYWWLPPVLAGVLFLTWLMTGPEWSRPRSGKTTAMGPLPGYVLSFATVAEEYRRFYGKELKDPAIAAQFAQATQLMNRHDYGSSASSLEEVAKTAAVPAVFNNLGVVYLAQDDRGDAVNAFREALARDIGYRQVHQNMDRLKEIGLENAAPLTREIEPNNTMTVANIIAPERPVEGEIMASVDDMDTFKVTTPPAPRDIVSIEVQPRTRLLEPMMKVYDDQHHLLQWINGKDAPGKSISITMAPPPNTTLFLQLAGYGDTAGLYVLKVTPRKAFDQYEPNDEIYNSRPIRIGAIVDANIMDKGDTDYYSFETERAGKVRVSIENRSATLIPALSTFTPDQRSSGFGPDVRTPGANLEHSFNVQANQKYYIQVWSQANTAGEYTLKLRQ